jgi:hypothetical protein
MKFRMIAYICFTLVGSLIQNAATAIIIEATVLQSPEKNLIYLFGDYHDERPFAKTQADYIIAQARHLSAPIVFENMFEYTGNYPVTRDYVTCESNQTLAQLTESQNVFAAFNVEYRQDKLCYAQTGAIDGAQMLNTMDAIVHEITHYNDNILLNNYRDRIIQQVLPIHQKIKKHITNASNRTTAFHAIQNDHTLWNMVQKAYPDRPLSTAQELINMYDIDLLDVRILHRIHMLAKEHAHIFVCAGNHHIRSIKKLLTSCNYLQIPLAVTKDAGTIHSSSNTFHIVNIPAFFKLLPQQEDNFYKSSLAEKSAACSFLPFLIQILFLLFPLR